MNVTVIVGDINVPIIYICISLITNIPTSEMDNAIQCETNINHLATS